MKICTCFIETRNLPNLKEIIWDNHLNNLPKDWDFIWLGSKENIHNFITPRKESSKFIEIEEHLDSHKYNELLTSKEFWEKLAGYDRVLIFQHDSKILREWDEKKDDPFYGYDYIGACWTWSPFVGNGGLSWRNPKVMLEVLNRFNFKDYPAQNEDVFFSSRLSENPVIGRLAPKEIAEKFSIESIFKLGSLGVHAIERYLTPLQCKEIYSQYEIKNLAVIDHEIPTKNEFVNESELWMPTKEDLLKQILDLETDNKQYLLEIDFLKQKIEMLEAQLKYARGSTEDMLTLMKALTNK